MNKLLRQYQQIRNELVGYLEKLPAEKWNSPVYEGWTVKDLVAHLFGWAGYQIECLKLFASGSKDIPKPQVEDRNKESVTKRKDFTAEKVRDEFVTLSAKLIESYGNLTEDQWQKPIWEGTKTTPEKFIKIEIKHYRDTHFPELKKVTE